MLKLFIGMVKILAGYRCLLKVYYIFTKYICKGVIMNNVNHKGFVYEWTNAVNGRKYIGSHIGLESDNYVGSGVAFRRDLKRFGTMSFNRKILEYVNDPTDLPDLERDYLEKVNAKENPVYYNKTNSSSVTKKKKQVHKRGLCVACNVNPQAINYVDPDGVTHYRNSCSACIRKGRKLKKEPAAWQRAGYKKKPACEKCGFKFKLPEQSNVFHIDGNLKNNNDFNLKTICLNCTQEVYKSPVAWKISPLVPDF